MTTSSPTTVGEQRGGVQHGAVLDRGAGTDRDDAVVASEHRAGPDRRAGPERDVADDRGVGVDVRRRIDPWLDVTERVDRHRLTLQARRRTADTKGHGRGAHHDHRHAEADGQAPAVDPPQEGPVALGGGAGRRPQPTRARLLRAGQGPDPRERPVGARRFVRCRRRRARAEHDIAGARPGEPSRDEHRRHRQPAAQQPGRPRRHAVPAHAPQAAGAPAGQARSR